MFIARPSAQLHLTVCCSSYLMNDGLLEEEEEEEVQEEGSWDVEAAGLQSGEDVVAFFAKNGAQCPVKFITLNRSETGTQYRPYDLDVVSPRAVHTDHYTMSRHGIVHVRPGVATSFQPLATWMRESSQFNVLSSIGTFKNYLLRKCFNSWCHNVRFKLYCQQRKKLAAKLFLGMESFCIPLLNIKECTLETDSVCLLDSQASKPYESAQFVEHQTTKRALAAKELEQAMDKMQIIVQEVCKSVKNLASTKDAFSALGNWDYESKAGGDKAKSMQQMKQEDMDRKALVQRSENEARMLVDFIRLMDYVVVGHIVGLVINTMDDFLKELRKPRKVGLFSTDIHFTTDSTCFAPDQSSILGMINGIVDATINSANSVSRIIFTQPFGAIMANVITDSPHVGSIIRSSPRFQTLLQNITDKLVSDFTEAEEYVHVFDPVRDIYLFDQTWDFEAYRTADITKLRETLHNLDEWEKELDKMRTGGATGVLHVESRKLKSKLIPLNQTKLDQMKGLLIKLARERCALQVEDYKHRIQSQEERPSHLTAFSAQLEKLNVLATEIGPVKVATESVEEMYSLLKSYGAKISTEDEVQLDSLREVEANYDEEAEKAEAFIADSKKEQIDSLDSSIARLTEQVAQENASVSEGIFIDASHTDDTSPAMAELDMVRQKMENFEKLSKQYSSMQEQFGEQVNEPKNLIDFKAKFDLYTNQWESLTKWNNDYKHWMESDMKLHDFEAINKDVMNYFKDSFAIHKKLNNEVSGCLKERAMEFKAKMPNILDLGNPSMKPRHWAKLFKAMGKPYHDDLVFCLKELLDYGCLDHMDLVGELSATASGEAQLEESLIAIEKGWTDMKFITLSYRDSADVFVLGPLEETSTLLEDNQVTLQTMMGSRFISGVQDEVETWEKKLALLSETLDEWNACQKQWMYLETIFSKNNSLESASRWPEAAAGRSPIER